MTVDVPREEGRTSASGLEAPVGPLSSRRARWRSLGSYGYIEKYTVTMAGVYTKECEQRAQTDDCNIRPDSAKNSELQKNIIPSVHLPIPRLPHCLASFDTAASCQVLKSSNRTKVPSQQL